MSNALRLIVVVAIAAVLAWLAWPWLKNVMYVTELLAEEPPYALPLPVRGVAPRAVRDTFGAPRPGERTHQGVDIFAPRGDRHYYAHLDSVADIQTGQRVAPGDVLGAVGTTGNARGTPPHLHYGVYRRANGAINPFPLLTDKPSAPVRTESAPRKRASAADRSAE